MYLSCIASLQNCEKHNVNQMVLNWIECVESINVSFFGLHNIVTSNKRSWLHIQIFIPHIENFAKLVVVNEWTSQQFANAPNPSHTTVTSEAKLPVFCLFFPHWQLLSVVVWEFLGIVLTLTKRHYYGNRHKYPEMTEIARIKFQAEQDWSPVWTLPWRALHLHVFLQRSDSRFQMGACRKGEEKGEREEWGIHHLHVANRADNEIV